LTLLNKDPYRILSVHELFCLVYELLEGRGGVLWVSSSMNGLLDQIPLRSVAKTTLIMVIDRELLFVEPGHEVVEGLCLTRFRR